MFGAEKDQRSRYTLLSTAGFLTMALFFALSPFLPRDFLLQLRDPKKRPLFLTFLLIGSFLLLGAAILVALYTLMTL